MALFPLPVKAEITDNFVMSVRRLQFGDGYEQTAKSGLNNRPIERFEVEVVIADSIENQIFQNWLIEYGQDKPFEWQSPRDAIPRLYRIDGSVSGFKRNGGGRLPVFFTRKLTFKRYYNPVDLPIFLIPSSVTYSLQSFVILPSTRYSLEPSITIPNSTRTWLSIGQLIGDASTRYSYTAGYSIPTNSVRYALEVNTTIPVSTRYSAQQILSIGSSITYYYAP